MRRRFINSHKTFDYSKYMTIEALEDGYEVSFTRDVEYNLNGHKWVSLKANLNSPTLKKGDLLSLRCSLMQGEVFGGFKGNGKAINLRGNILSLIFKDDINLDISGYNYVFEGIFGFNKGSNIISVEKNFLPAKKLGVSCYYSMFSNCKNLITAPELPATTLAWGCYSNMFFSCTSLTTAPELPATTLANYCYYNMFQGCGKLNYIKMLATDISASNSLNNWVNGVASSGTFVKNPAMTSLPTGVSGIPSGWTVVNDGEESGGGNLITFYIADSAGLRPTLVEYQAIEGMTWGEWVDSKYNTIGIYIGVYDSVLTPDGFGITSHVGVSQKSNIVIISGEEYELG